MDKISVAEYQLLSNQCLAIKKDKIIIVRFCNQKFYKQSMNPSPIKCFLVHKRRTLLHSEVLPSENTL